MAGGLIKNKRRHRNKKQFVYGGKASMMILRVCPIETLPRIHAHKHGRFASISLKWARFLTLVMTFCRVAVKSNGTGKDMIEKVSASWD